MIELRNFSKSYCGAPGRFAVQDLSLTAADGAVTGLIGNNGAGKTTALNAVCALHYATTGAVYVDSVNPADDAEAVRNAVGYVPEYDRLPDFLTGAEFLDFSARLHGLSGAEKKAAFSKTIRDCALTPVLQKKIASLSKGWRKKLSLAATLIYRPKNLILDEPFSGLDPAETAHFRSLIQKEAETRAVLLSTHRMPEAAALCTTIYILVNGTLKAAGDTASILEASNTSSLEEAFVKLSGDAQ